MTDAGSSPELEEVFRLYREHLPEEARVLRGLVEAFQKGADESREQLRRFTHRVGGTAGTYEHHDISEAALTLKRRIDAGEPSEALIPDLTALLALLEKRSVS